MNLFNKKKGNRGFTLVELLATIVILGILSSMAIAGVSVLIKKAKNSEEEANAKVIQMAAESYLQANKDNAPRSIGECTTVSVVDLKNKKFLTDDITNSDSKSCMKNSYVKIFKSSNGEFIYTPYIYCGDAKETTSSKEKMVPIGEIKFSKTTDVNRASFVLNLYGDQNKTKGHYTPTTEIDGYSWSLSVMYEGDTSYTEIYNTGTLSANKAKSLEISENLADYVDISSTTKVKVDYMITNVACETYTSEMVSNGGASTGTEFEDTVPPTCGEVSGNATGENDWISNISSNKSRLVSVTCNDGDGSGCKRKSFSRSWPDKSKPSGVEKEYIDIYDNRDKKFEGNSETGNKTKCLVDVNVDLETPSASLIATKTATDNNNMLASGKPLKIEASTNPIASKVIHVSDYEGTTSNWMNKKDFSEGIYFKIDLEDNLHLDHYTWETNMGYQTSVNEKEVSSKNPDGVSNTLIPQEEKHGKTDLHGSTKYSIVVKLSVEGKRYGILTVYDKAGNSIKYEIYANIDRTAPKAATFDGKLIDKNDSKYDVYSYESPDDSLWTNSRVRINSTGTGMDEIEDPIQNIVLPNLSGHKQYYYYLYDVTNGTKEIKNREMISDGGVFTISDDGVYKLRFEDCDKAGNCSFSNWKYVRIDRTPPTCKPSIVHEGTEDKYTPATTGKDSWTNKSVRITQTCEDGKGTSGCTSQSSTPIFKIYDNEKLNAYAGAAGLNEGGVFYDNAGNSVTCPTYKVQIDKIPPTCDVSADHSDWTNSNVNITAKCNDDGGSNCKEQSHTYTFECTSSNSVNGVCKQGGLGAGDNGLPYTMYDVAGNSVVCPANQSVKIDKQAPVFTSNSLSNRNVSATAKDCDNEGVDCAGGATISYAFTTGGKPEPWDSIWSSNASGSMSCNTWTNVYVKVYDRLGNTNTVSTVPGGYQDDCCSKSNPYGCPWVTACRAGNTCVYRDKTRANRPGIYCDGIVAHVTSEDYMYILGYDGVHAYVFAPKYKDNAFLNNGYVYIWSKCINYNSPNSVCSFSKCPG